MYAAYGGEPAASDAVKAESAEDAGPKQSAGGDMPRVAVRFLLSGASAGGIIGKGGATITEFETQSGARIQLSKPKEVFPGTSDRSASPQARCAGPRTH